MSCSSCKSCGSYEALTRPRSSRQRNFGARVLVKVNGKQFWAHKKKGNPSNFARLHPKLRARAAAKKQVAKEMKARGQRVDITSAAFQRAVSARAGGRHRK